MKLNLTSKKSPATIEKGESLGMLSDRFTSGK